LRNALYKNVNIIIIIFLQLTNFTFCNGRGDNSSGCKDKPGKDIEIGLTVRSRKGKPPTKRKDDDDDNYGGNKGKEYNTNSLLTSMRVIILPQGRIKLTWPQNARNPIRGSQF